MSRLTTAPTARILRAEESPIACSLRFCRPTWSTWIMKIAAFPSARLGFPRLPDRCNGRQSDSGLQFVVQGVGVARRGKQGRLPQ